MVLKCQNLYKDSTYKFVSKISSPGVTENFVRQIFLQHAQVGHPHMKNAKVRLFHDSQSGKGSVMLWEILSQTQNRRKFPTTSAMSHSHMTNSGTRTDHATSNELRLLAAADPNCSTTGAIVINVYLFLILPLCCLARGQKSTQNTFCSSFFPWRTFLDDFALPWYAASDCTANGSIRMQTC